MPPADRDYVLAMSAKNQKAVAAYIYRLMTCDKLFHPSCDAEKLKLEHLSEDII